MRKILLLLIVLCSINSAFGQFYVSPSIGYGMSSAGILTGTSLNETQTKATNHYGSYGEGMNVQLRAGYFFSEMFGVELGVGYLHGADQNISSFNTDNDEFPNLITESVDGIARGRAYGLTASLVYNFNDHIYGKFGIATKLGGKTEAIFTRNTTTPFGPIVSEGVNDYHGRPPLGFTAVFGYKYSLNDNWSLFTELEYLGLNVTRNDSKFAELTINYPAVPDSVVPGGIPAGTWNLGDAPLQHPVYGVIWAPEEISYEDSLLQPNTDPTKTLSSVVAYSSFGLNVGVTYTFSKKEKN